MHCWCHWVVNACAGDKGSQSMVWLRKFWKLFWSFGGHMTEGSPQLNWKSRAGSPLAIYTKPVDSVFSMVWLAIQMQDSILLLTSRHENKVTILFTIMIATLIRQGMVFNMLCQNFREVCATPGASCVARWPLCHKVNLLSCIAWRPLCQRLNLTSSSAQQPLRHFIMSCDIFGKGNAEKPEHDHKC